MEGNNIEEAIVLCGGRGQRLRPYTDHLPKPMLRIAGRPVLEYVVRNLVKNKVKKAYFAVGYLGDKIEEYFKDGKDFGIDIEYYYEEKPLNTAGALVEFKSKVKSDFFIVSGDHLTSWNLREMGKHHLSKGAKVTIGFIRKRVALDYGIAEIENGFVKRFKEKPMEEYLINTGIYVMNKEAYEYVEVGKDLSKDVFPRMLAKDEKISAFIDDKEFWIDIGRVHDYERMNEQLSIIQLETKLFR